MDSNQVTEDGMPPLSEGNGRNLSAQDNEIRPRSPIHEESQLASEVRPPSLISEHAVSPHVRDPMPQSDSGSNSPHAQGPTPLRERGRDFSHRQTNNEGPRIRKSKHE